MPWLRILKSASSQTLFFIKCFEKCYENKFWGLKFVEDIINIFRNNIIDRKCKKLSLGSFKLKWKITFIVQIKFRKLKLEVNNFRKFKIDYRFIDTSRI
jgi:hypothetical protein